MKRHRIEERIRARSRAIELPLPSARERSPFTISKQIASSLRKLAVGWRTALAAGRR